MFRDFWLIFIFYLRTFGIYRDEIKHTGRKSRHLSRYDKDIWVLGRKKWLRALRAWTKKRVFCDDMPTKILKPISKKQNRRISYQSRENGRFFSLRQLPQNRQINAMRFIFDMDSPENSANLEKIIAITLLRANSGTQSNGTGTWSRRSRRIRYDTR